MAPQIGFIGLGNMGRGIAGNLQKKCGPVIVCDHHDENVQLLQKSGAIAETDAALLAGKCDVVFLSLKGPQQVRDALVGPNGLLINGRRGQYIFDLSTVDTTTSRQMAQEAEKMGITYIDTPVSGGVKGAADGTLTMMLGATEGEVSEFSPYLQAIAATFYYIGQRGGGSAIKIINNFMSFSILFINAEAVLMADHLGIPFDTFYDVVSSSSGGNSVLNHKQQKIRAHDIEANFTVDLVIKDLELAVQLCRDCGISNFSLNMVLQWYRMAQHRGYAQKDSSSIVQLLRDLEEAPRNTIS
jgi:2-hydroxymethylglutarate dehydrogenase